MTGRVASMPMYDLPEVRRVTTALWEIIVRFCPREGLTDVPNSLVHDRPGTWSSNAVLPIRKWTFRRYVKHAWWYC